MQIEAVHLVSLVGVSHRAPRTLEEDHACVEVSSKSGDSIGVIIIVQGNMGLFVFEFKRRCDVNRGL